MIRLAASTLVAVVLVFVCVRAAATAWAIPIAAICVAYGLAVAITEERR